MDAVEQSDQKNSVWDDAKTLFLAGVKPKQIALELEVSYSGLRSRATRNGWTKEREKTATLLASRAQQSLAKALNAREFGLEFRKRIIQRTDKHLERLDQAYALTSDGLEPKDLLSLQKTETEIFERAERASGLESAEIKSPEPLLNVAFLSSPFPNKDL